jgi:hypothetical protein
MPQIVHSTSSVCGGRSGGGSAGGFGASFAGGTGRFASEVAIKR